MENIYIARQPVFDRDGNIFAYELLYRDSSKNLTDVTDNLHATARVLINALNYIGLNDVTHGHKAFIKVDEQVVMDDIVEAIPAADFVLEVLETVNVSSELIKRLEKLHSKGYRFALNHYRFDDEFLRRFHALLSLIDYIKIRPQQVQEHVVDLVALQQYDVEIIAERIEEESEHFRAIGYGCSYFQGFYFSQPYLFEHENYDPDKELLLDLISMLKAGASLHDLVPKFNLSPFLVINLLKFIHKEEEVSKDAIGSIDEAVVIVGRDKILHWLELLYYATREGTSGEKESHAKHVIRHGIQRAVLMKQLAQVLKKPENFKQAAYFIGLLSIYEEMYQHQLSDLIKEIRFRKQIVDSLIQKTGDLGKLLRLVYAVEKHDLQAVEHFTTQFDISLQELNNCLLESYKENIYTL